MRLLALFALTALLVACSPAGGNSGAPQSAPASDDSGPPALSPATQAPTPGDIDPTRLAAHPDAAAYAEMFGVSLDEAIRRLELSPSIGELGALLEATYPETFAGMWIEHEPAFKVVAAFTADAEATLARHVAGTPLETIAEARTYPISYKTLQETQMDLNQRLLGVIPGVNSTGIDVRVNAIVIGVDDPAAFELALAAAGIELPPYVAVIQEGPAILE
jgi:hypothetical protein